MLNTSVCGCEYVWVGEGGGRGGKLVKLLGVTVFLFCGACLCIGDPIFTRLHLS